jgi:hypothetical protein
MHAYNTPVKQQVTKYIANTDSYLKRNPSKYVYYKYSGVGGWD